MRRKRSSALLRAKRLRRAHRALSGANHALREEVAGAELRQGHSLEELVRARRGTDAERDARRAALNLMEDAVIACRQAEAANRVKDEFLAVLSHELRTPLAAILLWGKALRSGMVRPPERPRALDAIVHAAETQTQLVDDLLDLSALTFGKLALAVSVVHVDALLREAADMVQPIANAKHVTLCCELAQGLDEALLDGGRVKQVVCNLLTNGVKFTSEHGRVTLRARKRDGELEVEVADTGEGIASDFLPYVFEPFRQADMTATREHAGLGIGLALAKQLVTLHGGSIHAASEGHGRGTVFRARLPWVAPASPSAMRGDREASSAPQATDAPLRTVHVLLVEDDVSTREAMQWTLERAGAKVTSVESGGEALAMMTRDLDLDAAPDVMVSDLGLPGMSGYELVERLAAFCSTTSRKMPRACAVTAHARHADRDRALRVGFDGYVTKPVSPEDLVAAVLQLHAAGPRPSDTGAVSPTPDHGRR